MHLLHLPFSQLRPPVTASLRPRLTGSHSAPARDRVIDFGKHKGRMLGSLPSSYLKWVSKNLRARDFEEWARLADEVLRDPVYRDRLEWESVERILTGDARRLNSSGPGESPVTDLIEASNRFGWDNEDRDAWARIDFKLLGTSKGGRIPRVQSHAAADGGHEERKGGIFRGDSKLASDSRPGLEKKSVVWGGKPIASRIVDAGSSASARRHTGGSKDGILGGDAMVSSDLRRRSEEKPIVSVGNSIVSRRGKMGAITMDSTSREQSIDRTLRGVSKGLHDENTASGRKGGFLTTGPKFVIGGGEEDEWKEMAEVVKRGNREERRERRRLKREQQLEMVRRKVGVEEGSGTRDEAAFTVKKKGVLADEQVVNPFPGRRSLLEKVRKRGGS